MATPAEVTKVRTARDDLERIGVDWYVETEGDGLTLFARDPADGQPRRVADLPIDLPYQFQSFLMRAPETIRLLIDLLDRCRRAYQDLAGPTPEPKKPRDFAAECSMKCANDRAFRQYLIEEHQLKDAGDTERVKTRVRSILAIQSMRELNDDPDAAERWKSLRRAFSSWRKAA